MKRPSSRWIATPLAACLTLALAGCGALGKKDASDGTEGAAETPAAEGKKTDAPAEEAADRPDARKDEEKDEEAKKETPPKDADAPDPAAAEEFKGLPKGEPEFILACRSLAAGGKGTMTGKDGYVFETRELAALAANSKTGTPRHAAMVAAIKAKADALRASGVELVIAPVPPKPVVYPDFLGAEPAVKDRRYDSYLQALYAELEKSGVRVADVTKALRSDRFDKGAGSFPRTGVLWSPAAVAASARAVHTATRKTEAAKAIARDKTIVSRDSALTQNGETFKARSVGWAQGDRLVPATVAKEGAPIMVIGDEHAGVHRSGGVNASLADQLSFLFGTPVDTRATAGLSWKEAADFTPAKDSPTKVVVWCLSAAQFLDAPAAPKKPARPRRPAPRAEDTGDALPAPRPTPGAGLQLRDDPGLEGRPE